MKQIAETELSNISGAGWGKFFGIIGTAVELVFTPNPTGIDKDGNADDQVPEKDDKDDDGGSGGSGGGC